MKRVKKYRAKVAAMTFLGSLLAGPGCLPEDFLINFADTAGTQVSNTLLQLIVIDGLKDAFDPDDGI